MKVIALMPVKNEEWILNVIIPSLKSYVDEILCLDVGSTDNTIEILKSHGVQVKSQADLSTMNFSLWRQNLLDWGRKKKGTHFVWLDADEGFTSNLSSNFKELLSSLKPGEKLALNWLCLWKSPWQYRLDRSVWSGLYKDFVFCDDGVSNFFQGTKLHEGRTPGKNIEFLWKKVPLIEGSVLHFQFVPFLRFQMKQALRRCQELVLKLSDVDSINFRYLPTMDNPHAKCKEIPKEWLKNFEGLEQLTKASNGWYLDEIIEHFNKKGIEYFEPLQIWHIPKLKEEFIKRTGRSPHAKSIPIYYKLMPFLRILLPKPLLNSLKYLKRKIQ